MHAQLSVAYVNKQINQISAKPPLKFDGDLSKFGLTSQVIKSLVVIFRHSTYNIRTLPRTWVWGVGCIWWVRSQSCALLLSLPCSMWYRDKIGRAKQGFTVPLGRISISHKTSVKCQSDVSILIPNLAGSKFCEILGSDFNPPIARFMGPTWGPSGADKTQMGPKLDLWTLLSE